jgi:hypothetical protein
MFDGVLVGLMAAGSFPCSIRTKKRVVYQLVMEKTMRSSNPPHHYSQTPQRVAGMQASQVGGWARKNWNGPVHIYLILRINGILAKAYYPMYDQGGFRLLFYANRHNERTNKARSHHHIYLPFLRKTYHVATTE